MGTGTVIRVLASNVINKIAAGEVVERPASALKELVENALDAGATQLDIEITAGGRKLVAVTDNGTGMLRDDALLAIERHATSKIRDVDDIERIDTLGFRGEALAAIASVSRFRLATCRAGETVGTEILVSAGKIRDVQEIGLPAGTVVEVRDLFHNVPARRKFLRSQQTELSHIRTGFVALALSHPAVGMTLKVDGRLLHQLPGGASLEDRVRDLFGPGALAELRPIHHRAGPLAVTGYAGLPSRARPDRGEQFIFVNGRHAAAPILFRAIREGYHTLLARDRFPSLFLFLEIEPDGVDVNIHPTKREVRFRNASAVRDAVIDAIRTALQGDVPGGSDAPPESLAHPVPAAEQLPIQDLPRLHAFKYPRVAGKGMADGGQMTEDGRQETPTDAPPRPSTLDPSPPWGWCRVLGQIGGLYVVLETDEGLVLMDPHAAHERVLFDRYLAACLGGSVQTQGLLMPETLEMKPADARRLRVLLDVLRAMGFGLCEFGGDSFVIDSVPACFSHAATEPLLLDILHDLAEAGPRRGKGRWREEQIARAACKSAVKARDRLTLEEVERLVADLGATDMPYTCPHGRPTMILTSFDELKRRFGR